ncbi:lactonase family protein [Granulicella sp. dw_53]|uniref:lactonase family protein n=1 Tax=Granulicella sp. dw_53 TaxID=2719792 RepID=UPI001BD31561|nr:lactonase family protein [Granulicella sp. dw_53]
MRISGRVSRRGFLRGVAFSGLTVAAEPWLAFAKDLDSGKLLLVGTQTDAPSSSKGIYAYRFEAGSGELQQIGLAVEAVDPTFLALAPDGRMVYSVNEVESSEGKAGGTVSSFTLDKRKASMRLVNEAFSKGGGPTHIAVDHTGRCVFAANYGGGSVASFAVGANGHLSEAVSFFQYSADAARQERKPHAHRVTVSPDNRFLLVNDLGLDEIHVYRLDAATAKLTPNDPLHWRATVGYGPRALQFHPNGRWAYCVNELKPTVNVLGWDSERGTLTTLQDISLVPQGYHGDAAPSDIVFDKEARFAYVASRLDDFMATFSVSPEDGRLTLLEHTSCGGKRPRHIALDPSGGWLLVANQDTDEIAVFARDKKTGRLAHTGKNFPLAKPQCLVFV